jgi:hypothetical protein
MTKEELYLRTVEDLFEKFPVKHRNQKGRYKRGGPTVTRQHRSRQLALEQIHMLLKRVNEGIFVYTPSWYNERVDTMKKLLVKGGIPKSIVTGVFTLLD